MWIARQKNGLLYLFNNKPELIQTDYGDYEIWVCDFEYTGEYNRADWDDGYILDVDICPNLKYEDEPIEVDFTFNLNTKERMIISDKEYAEYQELKKNKKGITFNLNMWSPYGTTCEINTEIEMSDDMKEDLRTAFIQNEYKISNFFEKSYKELSKGKEEYCKERITNANNKYNNLVDTFNRLPWYKKLFFKPSIERFPLL